MIASRTHAHIGTVLGLVLQWVVHDARGRHVVVVARSWSMEVRERHRADVLVHHHPNRRKSLEMHECDRASTIVSVPSSSRSANGTSSQLGGARPGCYPVVRSPAATPFTVA